MKVSKIKEVKKVIGYMSKVEERELQKLNDCNIELELYLCKSGTKYGIYEESTGSMLVVWKSTRKEAFQELENMIEKHGNKLIEAKENMLKKNGYIDSYNVGEWLNRKEAI